MNQHLLIAFWFGAFGLSSYSSLSLYSTPPPANPIVNIATAIPWLSFLPNPYLNAGVAIVYGAGLLTFLMVGFIMSQGWFPIGDHER
jgi:hypothetical protein